MPLRYRANGRGDQGAPNRLRPVWLLVALPLTAAAPLPASRTVLMQAGRPTPAWFVCDTTDAPLTLVAGEPGRGGALPMSLFPKAPHATAQRRDYRLGEADPGAGQIYYALSRGRRAVGTIHAVNPGMFDADTPVRLPAVTSVKLEDVQATCRLTPGARFQGFTARRSVVITGGARGAVGYRSYDLRPGAAGADAPTLALDGGQESRAGSGATFTFRSAGFAYVLAVPPEGVRAPATLTVTRGPKRVQVERFTAYSLVR
jgi:hypothetical protein